MCGLQLFADCNSSVSKYWTSHMPELCEWQLHAGYRLVDPNQCAILERTFADKHPFSYELAMAQFHLESAYSCIHPQLFDFQRK